MGNLELLSIFYVAVTTSVTLLTIFLCVLKICFKSKFELLFGEDEEDVDNYPGPPPTPVSVPRRSNRDCSTMETFNTSFFISEQLPTYKESMEPPPAYGAHSDYLTV